MAFDFPAAPIFGQTFADWQWDGEKWIALAGSMPAVFMGPNPPVNASPGWLWFDPNSAQLFVYYDDGSTRQWVVAINEPSPLVAVGTSPPNAPQNGTLWWDPNSAQLFVFYDDGTSQQWVVAINEPVSAGAVARLTRELRTVSDRITQLEREIAARS